MNRNNKMNTRTQNYCFKTKTITWWIVYCQENDRWNLATGSYSPDEVWGSYSTAEQAADDVYMQETGNDTWDMLKGVPDGIQDLENWILVHS